VSTVKSQVVHNRRLKELSDVAHLTELGKAFQQLTWRAAKENATALTLQLGLKNFKITSCVRISSEVNNFIINGSITS